MPHPYETRLVLLTEILAEQTAMDECLASGRSSETPEEPVLLKAREDGLGLELADGHHRLAQAIRESRPYILASIDPIPDDEPLQAPFYTFR